MLSSGEKKKATHEDIDKLDKMMRAAPQYHKGAAGSMGEKNLAAGFAKARSLAALEGDQGGAFGETGAGILAIGDVNTFKKDGGVKEEDDDDDEEKKKNNNKDSSDSDGEDAKWFDRDSVIPAEIKKHKLWYDKTIELVQSAKAEMCALLRNHKEEDVKSKDEASVVRSRYNALRIASYKLCEDKKPDDHDAVESTLTSENLAQAAADEPQPSQALATAGADASEKWALHPLIANGFNS